ncbi:MAG TPA: type II secretion system secretin GspD [Gammaproteobacteria bacterium]|nr:type II secretion system secretin GspD [Gammaproteobacteria bacterium]
MSCFRKFSFTKPFLIAAVLALAAAGAPGASAAAADAGSSADASQARISLNFKDADIREVAQSIGEIVGKNFILDPQVQGRVTVISSKPIPAEAVYSTFLSVLEVHGFAAVPAGSVTKIIPALKARQVPGVSPSQLGNAPGDAMITQVVSVDNVPAAQLVPVLRPLMSTQAHLAAYQPSNILIISDRVDNVQRLIRIIQRIDNTGTNAVDIIPLQYASATDIVRVLTGLLQGTQQASGNPIRLAADERTNSILIGGGQSERLRIKALIAQLDTPQKQGGNTQVIYLHYAKAKDLAEVLKGFVDASEKLQQGKNGAAAATRSGGEATVIADEGTNSLVVTAPPKMMRSIKDVISQLDIRRAEVFVQAIIAELNSDRSAELGITWAADAIQNHGAAGLTNFGGTGTGIAQLAGAAAAGQSGIGGTSFGGAGIGGGAAVASAIPDGLTLAVGRIVSGGFSFAALLRALAGNSETNILSAPSLVTLDNQEAKITVGQQVPFVTGSYTNGGLGGAGGATGGLGGGFVNPFTTVNRQQVGITLEITPQINKGDTVSLKIHQTVSSLAGSSRGAVDLITNNREIQTTVIAKNGQIIVLGGLMQNNLRESEQKVPLLGDIPLLGNLFKYRSSSNTKQNLLVFIRPTILRTAQSVSYFTNAKYEYLRQLQLSNESDVSLMPGATRPILPPFNAIQLTPGTETPTNTGATEVNEPPGAADSNDNASGGEAPPGV